MDRERTTEFVGNMVAWAYRMRRRAATFAAVVLALSLGYYVVVGQNGLHAYQVKRQEHQKLEKRIEALKQHNDEMQQEIRALKNDPDTIEREARERLHYARPDEVIVKIPQVQNHSRSGSAGQSGANQ